MRGTDFGRYGRYLDYFVKNNIQSIGLESGVSYFYFISKFFEFLSKPILISSIYVEPVYSLSIQLGNFFLMLLGFVGIFYLFDYLKIDKTLNLSCVSFLSIFPEDRSFSNNECLEINSSIVFCGIICFIF